MRDTSVDVLRFIGLAVVILAHVNPPELIHPLRNFDIPLMVLVSGAAFALSYQPKEAYFYYVIKRLIRLLTPVWLFLTVYFSMQLVFLPDSKMLEANNLLAAYTLTGGMGYIWIIRVFLFVALLAPLIYSIHLKISSSRRYVLLIAACFLANELIRYYSLPFIQNGGGKLLGDIVLYVFPYALIFALGIRLVQLSPEQVRYLAVIAISVFILVAIAFHIYYGKFIPTQYFKYPPSIYYFSYALFVALMLFYYRHKLEKIVGISPVKNIVLLASRNSIWIYLWHIPLVQLLPKIIDNQFILLYIAVFSSACFITFCQVFIVNHFMVQRISNLSLKRHVKTVLTG